MALSTMAVSDMAGRAAICSRSGSILLCIRSLAALARQAKRMGRVVDHIVPTGGCRVCGERGEHEPSNWQLLTSPENSFKGNRVTTAGGREGPRRRERTNNR